MEDDPLRSRVALRDIAKHLSVSHSTVSRALREDPRISETTRIRVRDAARRMGYRPDPALSALIAYRQGRAVVRVHAEIAWVSAWSAPGSWRDDRARQLYWQGADTAAYRAGYRLEEFRVGGPMSGARMQSILRARNITGVFIVDPAGVSAGATNLDWSGFSVVRFGWEGDEPRAPVVSSDQAGNAALAFRCMRERGYARIGLVATSTGPEPGGRLAAGFLMMQAGLPPAQRVAPLILSDAMPADRHRSDLAAWVKRERPDAVFTNVATLGGTLAALGLRAPGEIGLAMDSRLEGDPEAGIDQHAAEIGRAGFLALQSLLLENRRGSPPLLHHTIVSGNWVDGTSLPPR